MELILAAANYGANDSAHGAAVLRFHDAVLDLDLLDHLDRNLVAIAERPALDIFDLHAVEVISILRARRSVDLISGGFAFVARARSDLDQIVETSALRDDVEE